MLGLLPISGGEAFATRGNQLVHVFLDLDATRKVVASIDGAVRLAADQRVGAGGAADCVAFAGVVADVGRRCRVTAGRDELNAVAAWGQAGEGIPTVAAGCRG